MPRLRVIEKPPDSSKGTKEHKWQWETIQEMIEQHEYMKYEIEVLKQEINQLKYEKYQQNEESKVIDWYITVMEEGYCTKELWLELMQKRKDVEFLEGRLRVIQDEHNLKVSALRDKLKKTKLTLIKQNKEVVKPMVE